MTCRHRLVSSAPGAPGELSATRLLDAAQQASRLGCAVFALSGGEPFVHREIETIVDGLLEESGFSSFRVLKRFPHRVVRSHPFFSMTFAAEKASKQQVKRLMYRVRSPRS